MQSKSTSVTPAPMPHAPMSDAPTDPYVAGLWQQWRTQLRLTMKTPWLAGKWLEESRKLLDRAGRIYTHLCRQPRPIRRRLQRQLGASLAGVALALALANAPVQAADFTANDAASLIAAINNANNETTNPGPDTITLTGDVTLTAGNSYTYFSQTGLPLISSQITIEGAGHTIARDAGAPNFRLLTVNASGNLTLHQVTLTGGKSNSNGADGGGIYNRGTLTVSDSTLSGNHTYGYGGGIINRGTATLSNSTLSGNSASSGGGIRNNGTVTVNNSTLSGNSASFQGGGIFNNHDYTITLVRSLITGNSAPNGAELFNAPYWPAPTPHHPSMPGGTVYANNFNLIGYGGSARSDNFTPSGSDIVPSEALAAILDTTLADNGGPSTGSGTATLTHALVTGSPAVDAAGDSGLATDQRGVARPQGAADDIGAFELTPPPNAQINGSDCDLIDAIIAANTDTASGDCNAGSGADTITLLSDVTLTAGNTNVYSSATGLPLISSQITIEGAGYAIARDAGAPAFRLMAVSSSGNLTLNTVTLSGGNSQSHGGAIYNQGTVTVANSTLSANNTNLSGGAINNRGTMTVNNSTLSGNASGSGGAIKNRGTVTLSNSTISGNSAGTAGAIDNDGTVTLSNSTVSGNSAGTGGAFYITGGTVTLNRSLISGNQADNGAEIYNFGSVNAANFNLIGYGGDARSVNFTPSGSDIVPSVGLSAILDTTLADNGGPSTGSGTATLTHALVSGSPALDAAGDSGLATDQRGITRPQGAADDIGAFEVEVAAAPEIDITGNGVSIVSGDNEPDPADHTNFGSADIDGGTVVRTFTIHNSGDGDLTLSGSPLVAVSDASAFSVTSQPASSTIAAGESTTFEITFDPSASGLHNAIVTIAGDDSDESSYTFTIGGIGSERLLPNTQIAAAGAATQSCATGSEGYVYDCTVTFNLRNVAGDDMLIAHYRVNSISTHAEVLNGEPAPGQAGTIVQAGELVNPDGTFQPEFVVGLKTATRYSIRFSVFGIANSGVTSASADAGATGEELVEIGTFDITFDPTAEPGAEGQSFQLYLPTVVNQ